MTLEKGTIIGFGGTWLSGLGSLIIDDVHAGVVTIHCENGSAVRAMEHAFGNVIATGHMVNPRGGHVGQEIYYTTDAFGVLEGFTPVAEASQELVTAYEDLHNNAE